MKVYVVFKKGNCNEMAAVFSSEKNALTYISWHQNTVSDIIQDVEVDKVVDEP